MPTELPKELLELIFHDLEWNSIKNISVVSFEFLALARGILFQKVNLFRKPPRNADDGRACHTQFFEFLLGDAHVASRIQELSLHSNKTVDADEDRQSIADNLIRLLPKLTRLKHLSIHSNYYVDWTSQNDDLRTAIMQLCLLPQVQSLDLEFMRLRRRELSLLTSIPKVTLFCIDTTVDPQTTSVEALSPSSSSLSSTKLQDLTITVKYSADDLSAIWSIVEAAGSSLTSLRLYSSPYDDECSLSFLDDVDLRRHPALHSLSITIPLTSKDCMEKVASIFSPLLVDRAGSSSGIKCIEICCDVDIHSYPSQETVNRWNWARLDAILSSDTFSNLERLEITVKKVSRGNTTWQRQRKYEDLKGLLIELFRSRLPALVSERVNVITDPPIE